MSRPVKIKDETFRKDDMAVANLIINKVVVSTIKNAKTTERKVVLEDKAMNEQHIFIKEDISRCNAYIDNPDVLTDFYEKTYDPIVIQDVKTNTSYIFSKANILNLKNGEILIQGEKLTINS